MPQKPIKARTEEDPAIIQFRWLLRFLGVLYAVLAIVYAFFHVEFLYLMNVPPRLLQLAEAVPDPTDRFWLVQSVGLMAMLSAISFLGAQRLEQLSFFLIHLMAKLISVGGFLYLFLYEKRYFLYAMGTASEVLITLMLSVAFIRYLRTGT